MSNLFVTFTLACNSIEGIEAMHNEQLGFTTLNSLKNDDSRPYIYSDDPPALMSIGETKESIEIALKKLGFIKVNCFCEGYAPLDVNNILLVKRNNNGGFEKAYFISTQIKSKGELPYPQKTKVILNGIIFQKNQWQLPRPYLENVYPEGEFNILSWRHVSSVMHTTPMVSYGAKNRPCSDNEEILFSAINKFGLEATITRIFQEKNPESYSIHIANSPFINNKLNQYLEVKNIVNESNTAEGDENNETKCECIIF